MANALKAVFGAQTLTTASYFPACAQDGTPSGVISAANLASVLGVIGDYDLGSSVRDMDSLGNGFYFANFWSSAWHESQYHAPNINGYVLIFSLTNRTSPKMQIVLSAGGECQLRFMNYNSSTWGAWTKLSTT